MGRAEAADKVSVTWLLVIFTMQDTRSQAERIRAAMESSLEQQRASVRRQVEAVHSVIEAPQAQAACEPIAQPDLARMIDEAARKHGVDPALVREVARQESGFRPCVVSPKGAEGLMQLMPATQAQFQVRDPFQAEESLAAGAKLLKQLLDRYNGDLSLALSAYNAGSGRVDKAGGIPEIPETKNYVADILGRLLQ
ncbi:MAG: lytic transglycosylase [Acidobacteria bacterium]|nr:MAG: lytic transglycosylase [Acidobacteriota bacterium]